MTNIKDLYSFNEKELLCTLYVKEFLKENVSSEYFSYEEIISAITLKYLKRYGECSLTDKELTDWLKDNYRYPLLNELIQNEIIRICYCKGGKDNFILDNLESLLEIITLEVKENIFSEFNYDFSKINEGKRLTEEEFRKLVIKFLKMVDPSLEWLNICKNALKNGQIHFVKADDLIEKNRLLKVLGLNDRRVEDLSWNFTLVSENSLDIVVERNFTIQDFWAFIHEFIHFIEELMIYEKNTSLQKSLSLEEFSTIIYEKLALDFLSHEGYDTEEIEKMVHLRNFNTYKTGIDIIPIFDFMKKMLLNGQITSEEEIKNAQAAVDLNNKLFTREMKEKLKEDGSYYFSALEYSDHFCDEAITSLITCTGMVQKEYPYVIGNYLARLMLEKLKTKELAYEDMKNIVENISVINPNDLFAVLGVNLKESKSPKKFYLI